MTGGYLAPFLNSGEATPGNVSLTLQGAAFLMGGSGENWIKDDLETPQGVCLVRALEYAAPNYESYSAAVDLLKQTVGESHLDRWNNAPATTYRDVQNALQSANNTLHPSFSDRLSAIAGRVAGFFRNRS